MKRYLLSLAMMLPAACVAAERLDFSGLTADQKTAIRTALDLNTVYKPTNPPGWSVITGKPTTLSGYGITNAEAALGNPATNGYLLSSTTGGTRSWVAPASGGTWGSITGTLSSQTDLNSALAAKAASGDNTDLTAITGGVWVYQSTGKAKFFAPSADTDAARATAFDSAYDYAWTLTGPMVMKLAPGNYYLSKAYTNTSGIKWQYMIKDKMIIMLNGARLYHTATENDRNMFIASLGTSNLAHDWYVMGPGILEGATPTPSGTTTGAHAGTGECGIHVAGASGYSYRYNIAFLTARYFTNAGIMLNGASYPTWKFTSGQITNCKLDYNKVGLAGFSAHEFVQISNTTANYCQRGFYVDAGNWSFSNCIANATTSDGLYVHSSGNNAHGTWEGGNISHNYNNAVCFATGVTNGWSFSGTHFGGSDGTTPNKMVLDGYGITINGGQMDSLIYTTAVNSGWNSISNAYISGNSTTILNNLYSGSRIKLKIRGCQTATGMWSGNDLQTYTFADNTAALAGGLTAGESYKTSTGEVRVAY